MKTKQSTVRYAAKQAYQLALMQGIYSSTHAGHYCTVHPSELTGRCVKVHGVEDAKGQFHVQSVPIAKAWSSL